MTENLVISRWRPSTVLRVCGDDAFTFLQGQFTNDLREVAIRDAIYGLWLNHKGRVIADSFVKQIRANDFLIVSYFCPAEVIFKRLESYVIADDVTLEDVTSDWRGITFLGGEVIRPPAEDGILSFGGRRTRGASEEWLFPRSMEARVAALVKEIPEIDAEALHRIRIADTVPAVPMDIGPGELPNEGGLDASAISYVKGCYLGQEVMARLKSMGQVRRRLFHVRGSIQDVPSPADVYQGDRRIGELRTRCVTGEGFDALALLSLINLRPEAGLSFSIGGATVMKIVGSP